MRNTQALPPARSRLFVRALLGCACLVLNSCATPKTPPPPLPPETSFNESAGRGDWLRVKLHMGGDRDIAVTLDTGGPRTVLDKSLEPWLGKRLGRGTWWEPFLGGLVKVGIYRTPKLSLGGTRLITGDWVYTYDLQKDSPGLMGIIGVDCLRNYCLQFNFKNHKMRFLDPDLPGREHWGDALPLTILFGVVIARADCFGTGKIFFCPDTGYDCGDVMLKPTLFNRALKQHPPVWTNQFTVRAGVSKRAAGFARGDFGGRTYSDLTFMEWAGAWPAGDLVGLPFLARHLVTFDFPKRRLYLQPVQAGPCNPEPFLALDAGDYLNRLRKQGRLPGWAKTDRGQGELLPDPHRDATLPLALTFLIHKNSAASAYHYTLVRTAEGGPWRLAKAWRTEAGGKVSEEYPVPQ
jgi:hypothetical protein